MSSLAFLHARRALLGAALLAAWPCVALAATTPGDFKDVAVRLTATGTVTAIDVERRRLTLRGRRSEAVYRVDPKVGDLQGVKVGDRVKIDYVAAMVVMLKRGAGQSAQGEAQGQAQLPPSPHEPGAVVATGTTVTTRVLAVNRKARTVRLRGPEGRVADYTVQDAADLVGVRPGDQVAAVLHEAVVVGLEPASR